MKTPKSPENEEVTPSKKKLKQARLPFKIISDVSPKPETPPSRKRKLSVPEPEPVTKIGKIIKENESSEPVVIIDDDSRDSSKPQGDKQMMNPFVKLVDNAWKKKQQKSKSLKKKKSKKSVASNGSVDSVEKTSDDDDKGTQSVERMEVDDDLQEVNKVNDKEILSEEKIGESNDLKEQNGVVLKNSEVKIPAEVELDERHDVKETDSIVVIEDSNQDAEKNDSETENDDKENSENVDTCEKSDSESGDTVKIDEPDSKAEPMITPKRSSCSKDKQANKLNTSQLSTGDESAGSNPSTPRRSMRSSSVTKNQDVSLNESNTNLTPKQLQKKLESAKKKEEREKEKQEREKKRQQEKEERAKQRQEKEEQRKREKEEKEEAKRKEKEEKEEQKRKEKEEKERQRELEKKLREEKEEQKRKEKEEKEEQRRKEKEAREEERRKKQEALELEKLEQEQKKKKAAEAFVNFFVPKQKVDKDSTTIGPISKSSVLSSFAIKSDMRLAPTVRTNLTEEKRQALDKVLKEQDVPKSSLYVNSLKAGVSKPLSSGKTWPLDEKDDDIMIVEDEMPPIDGAGEILTCDSTIREKLRPKLFSFHENRRPPYWGTWRKKSTYISPRRPFQLDQKQLDYEVDSDDDWEEEPEGESVDGSAAGSDDEQDADEYEVDNEVFVPHGYLSDEEATMDEDDVLSLSPETQKARLKHLEDEFELELKKPTEKLKPRLYGLLWETSDGSKPEKCVDTLWNYFGKLAMIMNDPTAVLQPSFEPEEVEKKKVKKKKSLPDTDQQSPKSEKKKIKQDVKENKKSKADIKKNTPDVKKNQPGINSFLTKIKS